MFSAYCLVLLSFPFDRMIVAVGSEVVEGSCRKKRCLPTAAVLLAPRNHRDCHAHSLRHGGGAYNELDSR